MKRSLHHIALRTQNLEALQGFYVALLGLPVIPRNDARGSVWLDLGGTTLMLERAAPDEPAAPSGTLDLIAFAVDDLETWRDRFFDAGVSIEGQTAHTLYVRDPDGRRVGVSNYRF